MDEIDFKRMYNDAVNGANAAMDPHVRTALMYMLQLIDDLNVRLVELQVDDEDYKEVNDE